MIALMTILCLTLGGCGSQDRGQSKAKEIQSRYAQSDEIEITADVTADYGDRVYDFSLQYIGGGSDGTVTVLSPENIAGLTARLSAGSGRLEYDGAELSIGGLTTDGLSPMEALPTMVKQWKTGFIEAAQDEKLNGSDTVAVTYTISGTEYLITWFDGDTMLPIRGELFFDGAMVVAADFEHVTF